MSGKTKRSQQMIGKLSELLVSGNKTGFLDVGSSPRSPLDFRTNVSPSPRGMKNYDVGKVGLGIVAALDKSSCSSEAAKTHGICSSCGRGKRSDPIPVNSGKNYEKSGTGVDVNEETEMESMENYTYVTSRAGPNKSFTKVIYDGGDCKPKSREEVDVDVGAVPRSNEELKAKHVDYFSLYPTAGFLSSCHLCNKKLHGKDIYIYRGEHAFCSVDCRSTHIMKEVRQEHCRSQVPRSVDVSASASYTTSPIFSNGIFAI